MEPFEFKFTKVRDVKSPTRGTDESAGIDFYVPHDFNPPPFGRSATKMLVPGESVLIPSGIHVSIPKGTALVALNKSGVATKKGLVAGANLVDSDYQGEVHIHLMNVSKERAYINPGDKIIQFVLVPVYLSDISECKTLDRLYGGQTSERGSGGFGSTGNL